MKKWENPVLSNVGLEATKTIGCSYHSATPTDDREYQPGTPGIWCCTCKNTCEYAGTDGGTGIGCAVS